MWVSCCGSRHPQVSIGYFLNNGTILEKNNELVNLALVAFFTFACRYVNLLLEIVAYCIVQII